MGADCPPACLEREGIMKCKFLPPRKLYHPVFPYKCNSNLLFPLCSSYANTKNQGSCSHSDEERCIVGNLIGYEARKSVICGLWFTGCV